MVLGSNNSPSGVKTATKMFPMSPTSWASCSTRLANWKISSSTAMTSTVSPSRASATLRLLFSPAATVCALCSKLRSFNTNVHTLIGKQKITDEIAKLKYKDPNSPRIVVLEQELVRAEAESLVAEAQLSNITREKLKAAFQYQFDALREHCEKVALIAGYGKHLLDLVDDTPVTPGETRHAYDGYDASKAIIQDCEEALANWVTSKASVKPTLSQRSRTLSQRHRETLKGREGVDLSGQDQPMGRDSWVPADQHATYQHEVEDGEEVASTVDGESRGREEEREPVTVSV